MTSTGAVGRGVARRALEPAVRRGVRARSPARPPRSSRRRRLTQQAGGDRDARVGVEQRAQRRVPAGLDAPVEVHEREQPPARRLGAAVAAGAEADVLLEPQRRAAGQCRSTSCQLPSADPESTTMHSTRSASVAPASASSAAGRQPRRCGSRAPRTALVRRSWRRILTTRAAPPDTLVRMTKLDGRPVLVTGAGGFIGGHLVARLVAEGARVRALVRYNSRGDRGTLDWLDPAVVARGGVDRAASCATSSP